MIAVSAKKNKSARQQTGVFTFCFYIHLIFACWKMHRNLDTIEIGSINERGWVHAVQAIACDAGNFQEWVRADSRAFDREHSDSAFSVAFVFGDACGYYKYCACRSVDCDLADFLSMPKLQKASAALWIRQRRPHVPSLRRAVSITKIKRMNHLVHALFYFTQPVPSNNGIKLSFCVPPSWMNAF